MLPPGRRVLVLSAAAARGRHTACAGWVWGTGGSGKGRNSGLDGEPEVRRPSSGCGRVRVSQGLLQAAPLLLPSAHVVLAALLCCRSPTPRQKSLSVENRRSKQRQTGMADKQEQPAQVFSDSKWDAALDLCLRRAMYGTLAGGLAALLLLSEWRRAVAAAAGLGVGRVMD